jgi:DNA-nicking Smr family endonuclease
VKKPKPFNNPFLGLSLPAPKPPEAARPAAPPPPPPAPTPGDDEAAQFLAAVGEVRPVPRGAHRVEPAKKSALPPRTDEDAEVLAQLSELVAGDAPFDLADSDEFIEGSLPSLDPRLLRKLRAGEIALQGHVDLHGLTREGAKRSLEQFLLSSRQAGKRCVLVVHGRGLHSKDQIPVLKASVQLWLTRGRIARWVLGFTTARPHDGGAGAVYVLLRR